MKFLEISGEKYISRLIFPEKSSALLIYPSMDENRESLESLHSMAAEISGRSDFAICAIETNDWNSDLSPWEYGTGKQHFGGGGRQLLEYIEHGLIPKSCGLIGAKTDIPKIIGGYSLAGLFSLWSACERDIFACAVSCSGSLWFGGAAEYFRLNEIKADSVYLSLGTKEEKTRDPVMSAVGDRTRELYAQISGSKNAVLDWNSGGHFSDIPRRTAAGFGWAVKNTLRGESSEN